MHRHDGFGLIEVMVATALITATLLGLAQLAAASVASNTRARHATAAAVLASQKVDELRSAGPAPLAGVEYLDQRGMPLGPGPVPPRGAIFAREWAIRPLPGGTLGTVVIDVRVSRVGSGGARSGVLAAARRR